MGLGRRGPFRSGAGGGMYRVVGAAVLPVLGEILSVGGVFF